MTEQLVKYNTAKLASEAGFNSPCTTCRNNKDNIRTSNIQEWQNSTLAKDWVAIPTQSLLQKWMREKLNIICESRYNSEYNYYESYLFVMEIRQELIWLPTMGYTFECSLEDSIKEGLVHYIRSKDSIV